jgi:hypothetical protein
MKVIFKYKDESQLIPGYSRYREIVGDNDAVGMDHVGMIHLSHKDWRVSDGTMPPYVEIAIEARNAVSSSKGVAARPVEKPKANKAPARTGKTSADRTKRRG